MNVAVRIRSRQLTEALRAYIDRKVYSSLGRFGHRLQHVSVGISDVDRGTGIPYYSCRVEAELRPSGGPVLEEVSDVDLFRAIDRAMDKVGRALGEAGGSSPHAHRSVTPLGHAAAAGQGG